MTNTIYLCYKKEYRYRNIISSHRTSNGFKYTVQDEEEVLGPYISSLSFSPTYQDAVMINLIITKLRGTAITYFDDDWWADSFLSQKEENRTEYVGDLNVCEELNKILSNKYNITFISDDSGKLCTVDFVKEITPIINSLNDCIKDAWNDYNKEIAAYRGQVQACYEQIEKIEKEQESFSKGKNSYLINKCHSVFRNMVLNSSINPNEKVPALFDEYPLDIANVCGDNDLYLYLIKNGALRSNCSINIDYALQVANIAALKKILSMGGDINWDSTYSFEPIKCIGDIKIKSIFDFFEKLPSDFADSFFVPEPEPIAFDGIELSTHNLKILQLIIYRRFSYDWDARKRDDIYYYDEMFHNYFNQGISEEFDDIEPTSANCHTFKKLCHFYKRDCEYEVGSNVDNSDRYECEIDFDSKLKNCIKFRNFEFVKWYYSKYTIKRFLCRNIEKDFRNKCLNQDYLGETFYNYLIEIYEDESINID